MNDKLQESPKEQKVNMFEYNDAVRMLLKNSKEELENMQHQVLLARTELQITNERIIKNKNDHEIWKREETRKLSSVQIIKQNELDQREHALKINEDNFQRRSADLKVKELILEIKKIIKSPNAIAMMRLVAGPAPATSASPHF